MATAPALFDGRRFPLPPALDRFTHECLKMVVDHSLRTDDVAETVVRVVWPLDGAGLTRKLDNGSEFAHKVMDRWAYEDGVELDFSPSDTPTDNAMVDASTADSGRSV